jgi:hypothetical protein
MTPPAAMSRATVTSLSAASPRPAAPGPFAVG